MKDTAKSEIKPQIDDGFYTFDPKVSYDLLEQALGKKRLESAISYLMWNMSDSFSADRRVAEDEARRTLVDVLRICGVSNLIRR